MVEEIKASKYSKKAIEQIAERIATELGFKIGDDLLPIVESLGGKLVTDSSNEDGIETRDKNVFTIYASWINLSRHRFVIAFMLGIYFLHLEQGEIVVYSDNLFDEKTSWQARWFSASFLMPEEETIKRFKECKLLDCLYLDFGVTAKTLEVRLKQLGCIEETAE